MSNECIPKALTSAFANSGLVLTFHHALLVLSLKTS